MSTTPQSVNPQSVDEEWAASFGANLRAAREAAGLTRSKLARLLDVAEKNVANWETGRTLPSLPHYLRIRRALPDFGMPSYRSGKPKRRPTVPVQSPLVQIVRT